MFACREFERLVFVVSKSAYFEAIDRDADAGEEPTTVVESTATLAAQTAECLTSADFVGGQDGIITAGQWLHMEAGDQDTMIVVVLNKLFE